MATIGRPRKGENAGLSGLYCPKCQTTVPSRFSPSIVRYNSNKHHCRLCAKQYVKRWQGKNRPYFRKWDKDRRTKGMEFLQKWKTDQGCRECGERHVACLDFHHLVPSNKKFNVSKGASRSRLTDECLLAEIEKCEVLCSNCHRKLHWEGRKNVRLIPTNAS